MQGRRPVRQGSGLAVGRPGAMWAVRSVLRAIQASSWRRPHWRQPRECVEMTPPGRRRSPLLTLARKWSSSSGTINGDRSLQGEGGRHGGGAAGPAEVGASAAEVKQHIDPQRGTAAQWVTKTHNADWDGPPSPPRRHTHHTDLQHTTSVSDISMTQRGQGVKQTVPTDTHSRITDITIQPFTLSHN